MAISDLEYAAWLANPSTNKQVLVVAKYYDTSEEIIYLSDGVYITGPAESPPNQPFIDKIVSIPNFTRRVDPRTLKSSFAVGDIVISNPDGDFDPWLEYGWDGRDITIYYGDPTWEFADFRPLLTGAISDVAASNDTQIAIKIRDKGDRLNGPLKIGTIDPPTPRCYGECYNISPRLIDEPTHTYRINDGSIEDILDVRENGVTVSFSKNLSAGAFSLLIAPLGQVTADVKGMKVGPGPSPPSPVYVNKVADIVRDIVTKQEVLADEEIDDANFAAFNVDVPYIVGIYIDDRRNMLDVLEELLGGVGAFWDFSPEGKMQLHVLNPPTAIAVQDLSVDDLYQKNAIKLKKKELPMYYFSLRGKPNFTRQEQGLAGSVSELDRAQWLDEFVIKKGTGGGGVRQKFLLAESPPYVPCHAVVNADLSTETIRRAALYLSTFPGTYVMRLTFTVKATIKALSLSLGDTVELTYPRFGFDAGKKCLVIGMQENITERYVKLDLWL